MTSSTRHVVAVYDVAHAFGGSEEGGWWFECGSLVRTSRIFRSEEAAWAYANRLNDKLGQGLGAYRNAEGLNARLRRRMISSVASDGVLRAMVFPETAPQGFPASRPHYE